MMDQPQSEDENDALVDGIVEGQSEDEISEVSKAKEKLFHTQTLLDKSFSIDEDLLSPPLEPELVDLSPPCTTLSNDNSINEEDIFDLNLNNNALDMDFFSGQTTSTASTNLTQIEEGKELRLDDPAGGGDAGIFMEMASGNLCSILRSNSDSPPFPSIYTRRVSFPIDQACLATYREPDRTTKWTIVEELTPEDLVKIYQTSCKKHFTIELEALVKQFQNVKNNRDYSSTLSLSMIKVTSHVNETLEDILKVVNFHTIILQNADFTPETLGAFMNMLEYYESMLHLEFSMPFEDDYSWKCFCNTICNSSKLESVTFRNMSFNYIYMRCLENVILTNENINTFRFDGCELLLQPRFYLLEALMPVHNIRELYLPSNKLYTKEAEALLKYLMMNSGIKVLDISNNNIGDHGLGVISNGLFKVKDSSPCSLSVFIVFNNQITEKSGEAIGNIIISCPFLHTINIGCNNLKDEGLMHISESISSTVSLKGLGLQCTLLTCKGIDFLAKAIPNNSSLEKISLKGNKAIQTAGIEALCLALTHSKITKIEIDETNRSCSNPETYRDAVIKMTAICTANKSRADNTLEDEKNKLAQILRKVSLSCEPICTLPDVSTTPIAIPATKSRFHISRVSESSSSSSCSTPTRTKSRFRVTPVPSSPEEDVSCGRFANVRSSLSSNDSVDF